MTNDQVRQSLANFLPELANAETLKAVKRGEDEIIEYKRRVGTKGAETVTEEKTISSKEMLCPECDGQMDVLGEDHYGCAGCGITVTIQHGYDPES
jgi:tRNA(Ile2) C34 agmatinyltransferase TiaS